MLLNCRRPPVIVQEEESFQIGMTHRVRDKDGLSKSWLPPPAASTTRVFSRQTDGTNRNSLLLLCCFLFLWVYLTLNGIVSVLVFWDYERLQVKNLSLQGD